MPLISIHNSNHDDMKVLALDLGCCTPMSNAMSGTRKTEDGPAMALRSGGLVLYLVLTHHWYDQTESGAKCVEYRRLVPMWVDRIYNRRDEITHVRFARGYTTTTQTFRVKQIDIGPCPIPGWGGDYIRIHFLPNVRMNLPNVPDEPQALGTPKI